MRTKTKSDYNATVFEELKDLLYGYNIQSVSEISGVAQCTLYFWMDGTTQKPRIDTLSKVAEAIGYRIELRLVGKSRVRRGHLRVVK